MIANEPVLPETVEIFPELAQAVLRRRQPVPLACWALLRAISAATGGPGWLERTVARQALAAFREVHPRRARGILQDGDGVYWNTTGEKVWLSAPSRVAAQFGVDHVGRAHVIRVEDLCGQAQLRAALMATCYAADGGGSPLSRRQVEQLTGVSPASQRRYEHGWGHAQPVETIHVALTHVRSEHAAVHVQHHRDQGFYVGAGGDAMRRHADIRRPTRHDAASRRKTLRTNRKLRESARQESPAEKTRGERSRRAFFPLTARGGAGHTAWVKARDALGKPGHEAAMSEAAFDYAVIAVPKRGGGQRYESASLPDQPGNRLIGSSQTGGVGTPPDDPGLGETSYVGNSRSNDCRTAEDDEE